MNQETRDTIKEIIWDCVNGALERMVKGITYRPFHEALLTKELVTAAAFERSFSTSLGQGPIENISSIIAAHNGAKSERQKETMVNVYKGAIDEIERIMSSLRSGEKQPNWQQEVKRVCSYQKGDTEVRRVISDLWIKKEETEIFISIKTVKPNLDQTEIVKRNMLLLKSHNPKYQTYLGLFYNPGGQKRTDYNWTMPFKIFDMHNDDCVLIGKDYWDLLGGTGTYNELLKIFQEVGIDTRKKLLSISKKLQ